MKRYIDRSFKNINFYFLCLLCTLVIINISCDNINGKFFYVSGRIECKVHLPGSTIGGRIKEVRVKEGDTVKKDDILVIFDCDQHEAMYQAAKAGVQRAESLLQKLKTGATQEELRQAEQTVKSAEAQYNLLIAGAREEDKNSAKAALDSARSALEIAKSNFDRAERLFQEGALSKKEWEQAKVAFEKVQGEYQIAEEKYKQLLRGAREQEIEAAKANWERAIAMLDEVKRGPRIEDIRSAEAVLESAKADLLRAESVIKECTVKSPVDGLVESVSVRVGDIVPPGPCVRIVNPNDLEMFIFVPADILGFLRVGETLSFRTDTYQDEEFYGKIIYIASEGEFTPRNLQTQEERIQQVFAVKLSLTSHGGKLRAGMTATVRIPTAKE